MTRPLRIEFPDALYHVTSRGDRREPIFVDDVDRQAMLEVLGRACETFDASVFAYCLMGNHYHLVLGTRRPNLSLVMRQLNGVYTQRYNRRHGKVGHVFQGRFKAIVVDRESYFLSVCRYVELNPVRAHMVATPERWPWSSFRAHTGAVAPPPWLDTAAVHAALLGREARTAAQRGSAQRQYDALVRSAPGFALWEGGLRQQVFLGDEPFVQRMQQLAGGGRLESKAIPRAQRARPVALAEWMRTCATREEALYRAHAESGMSMTRIAEEIDLSVGRVSQLIARFRVQAGSKGAGR